MKEPRKGLRVRCEKGIHEDVRNACIEFCTWLRMEMNFPIRLVVYIKKAASLINVTTKEQVSATFFAPYQKSEEPYIRIATGDYEELVKEQGEIGALYSIINSIAHEIVHYKQWLADKELDEELAELEGEGLVERYIEYYS